MLEQESANYHVDEIWSWEAANHGDSCLINADVLGGLCKSVQAPNTALLKHPTSPDDWRDNSRDILQFLQYYLPTAATPDALPTVLPRLEDAEADSRIQDGLHRRNVVFVGHSFGGCTVVRAALEQPQLFKSLFMLEAMIRPLEGNVPKTTEPIKKLVTGAVRRRDGWSSK